MTGPRLTTTEMLMELAREFVATFLVLLLIIPGLIIHLVATVWTIIVRWRGGID